MIILLALALTASQPAPIEVDRVELNHYCVDGEHRYTQVILCRSMRMERWSSHVANWRLLDRDPKTNEPKFSRSRGSAFDTIRFYCRGELTIVHARHYHETTTAIDPEYWDREKLHETDRMSYFPQVSE